MNTIDFTHDPQARSWVAGADQSAEFPVQNIPFGIFSISGGAPRVGVAIGDYVLDLAGLADEGLLLQAATSAARSTDLNTYFAMSGADRLALRHCLFRLLTAADQKARIEPHLHPVTDCTLHLPARIGDYTDFYVGIHHATNIGKQFRPDNPLLPNYKYVPIGYHGRASSIRVSGYPVKRPKGQRKPPEANAPNYGPCRRLDYELEMGVWIAGENALGETVPIDDAADRIAGLCLLNDWSARDIQAWEYQPLGPFQSKNFVTTISPWVVTMEALAPFRIAQSARPDGDPVPLPYLYSQDDQDHGALAIQLEVWLSSKSMRDAKIEPMRLSSGSASNMYWTIAQMVTHHTANGCNLMPGDLLGTGTISGSEPDSLGSLAEISRGGTAPIMLPTGESRSFLEDGDELALRASAQRDGYQSIGFGCCSGVVQD